MKRSEIQLGATYAVVTGSMYEGAEANAEPAIVLETGVAVDNFNHSGRQSWSRRNPSSTTTDGVRVQLLDRQTFEPIRESVVKSRNVVALWADHEESQRLQRERAAAIAQRSKDSQKALEEWTERLGVRSFDMPSLSGGIQGGAGWNTEYTRNRAALVRMLERAYELGRKDASA